MQRHIEMIVQPQPAVDRQPMPRDVIQRIGATVGDRLPRLFRRVEIVLPHAPLGDIQPNLPRRFFDELPFFHHGDAQLARQPVVQPAPGMHPIDRKVRRQQLLISRQPQRRVPPSQLQKIGILRQTRGRLEERRKVGIARPFEQQFHIRVDLFAERVESRERRLPLPDLLVLRIGRGMAADERTQVVRQPFQTLHLAEEGRPDLHCGRRDCHCGQFVGAVRERFQVFPKPLDRLLKRPGRRIGKQGIEVPVDGILTHGATALFCNEELPPEVLREPDPSASLRAAPSPGAGSVSARRDHWFRRSAFPGHLSNSSTGFESRTTATPFTNTCSIPVQV